VATAIGLVWRARNGTMRDVRTGVTPAGVTTAGVTTAGAMMAGVTTAAGPAAGPRVTTAELGQPLGDRATLLQFSSAFCAPCRATRRVLAEVAGMTPGVAHIEIDAESRLDLVRALGVLRTPTVLVLAADGRIVRRASGQPRKADVIGALGLAVDGASDTVDGAPGSSLTGDKAIVYSSGLETG
jgi:thiol-disulfide isomerase/thioredoxin